MPSTKERFDQIDFRLDRIDEALGLRPPQPKSKFAEFRADLWTKIKAHKGTIIPLTALVLAIPGWFAAAEFKYYLDHKDEDFNNRLDRRISFQLDKSGGISETLRDVKTKVDKADGIITTLGPFVQDIVKHQFEAASKLPEATLRERFPAMQHLLAVANNQQVKVDATTITRLSAKLNVISSNTPNFWPVAAEFINYRSQVSTANFEDLLRPDLPNCIDHDPTPMQVTDASPNKVTIANAYYQDCRFTLDSASDDAKINWILNYKAPALTFKHCLIVYRGGSFSLVVHITNRPSDLQVVGKPQTSILTTWTGDTLYFENCLFNFSLPNSPPKQGQEFTKQLLSKNGPIHEIPLAKPSPHS
jgi:hypothetical protein